MLKFCTSSGTSSLNRKKLKIFCPNTGVKPFIVAMVERRGGKSVQPNEQYKN